MFEFIVVFVGALIAYQLSVIIKFLKYDYQVSRIELVDSKLVNAHRTNFIRYRAKFKEENKQKKGGFTLITKDMIVICLLHI
jgi:hypothetical protein